MTKKKGTKGKRVPPKTKKASSKLKSASKPKKAIKTKSTKKKISKPRKVNRYIAIRSATSEYCREVYGKPCPNAEMNRIYWELKARYSEVPIGEVLKGMDKFLGHKDDSKVPEEVLAFPWFSLESLMYRGDGLFFKSEDTIIMDFSSLGMGVLETTYGNLPWEFRDNYYTALRSRSHEAMDNPTFAGGSDVIPYLIYDNSKSNVEGRIFYWGLSQGFATQDVVDAHTWVDAPIEHGREAKTATIEQNPVSSEAIRMKELEVQTNELRVKANSQREEALKRIDKMIDMGVITKEQYKGYYDDIMDKYARGGVL